MTQTCDPLYFAYVAFIIVVLYNIVIDIQIAKENFKFIFIHESDKYLSRMRLYDSKYIQHNNVYI
jgi:hypothetical protein